MPTTFTSDTLGITVELTADDIATLTKDARARILDGEPLDEVVSGEVELRFPADIALAERETVGSLAKDVVAEVQATLDRTRAEAALDLSASERTSPSQADVPDFYLSGADDPSGYNILLAFEEDVPDELRVTTARAAEVISSIITTDLPDVDFPDPVVPVIDDLLVDVFLITPDLLRDAGIPEGDIASAMGDVLGAASILELRDARDGGLPALSDLGLNPAAFRDDVDDEAFASVVLHELFHTVGVGNLWEFDGSAQTQFPGFAFPTFDLVDETDGGLRFTGAEATAAYAEVFPDIADADEFAYLGVPVEPGDEFDGTARVHWDEGVFGSNEILTSFNFSGAYEPLTDLTAASLRDLGYETVETVSDDAVASAIAALLPAPAPEEGTALLA